MGSNKIGGIFNVIVSAIAFGIMPILAKFSYSEGANTISTLAIRFAISALMLYSYIKCKKISLKLNRVQIITIIFLGVFGYSATSILLFMSYNYIDVGLASMIVYTYPLMVMLMTLVIYKEKFKLKKLIYLFVAILGIVFMLDIKGGTVNVIGIMFALLSAFSYAIYVVGIAKEEMQNINSFVMTFYISLVATVVNGVIGILNNSFTSNITSYGILYIILLAIISTIIGLMTFLKGVRIVGPTNASILSCLEPIISLVLGVLILKESLTFGIVIGSALIVGVIVLLTLDTVKN